MESPCSPLTGAQAAQAPAGYFPARMHSFQAQTNHTAPHMPKDSEMGNQKAMDAHSETLKVFSGNASGFRYWSQRFVDHMARAHIAWRPTLL